MAAHLEPRLSGHEQVHLRGRCGGRAVRLRRVRTPVPSTPTVRGMHPGTRVWRSGGTRRAGVPVGRKAPALAQRVLGKGGQCVGPRLVARALRIGAVPGGLERPGEHLPRRAGPGAP